MGAATADAAWGGAVRKVNQGNDAFHGGNFKAAAEALLKYLRGDQAKAVIKSYGYDFP